MEWERERETPSLCWICDKRKRPRNRKRCFSTPIILYTCHTIYVYGHAFCFCSLLLFEWVWLGDKNTQFSRVLNVFFCYRDIHFECLPFHTPPPLPPYHTCIIHYTLRAYLSTHTEEQNVTWMWVRARPFVVTKENKKTTKERDREYNPAHLFIHPNDFFFTFIYYYYFFLCFANAMLPRAKRF